MGRTEWNTLLLLITLRCLMPDCHYYRRRRPLFFRQLIMPLRCHFLRALICQLSIGAYYFRRHAYAAGRHYAVIPRCYGDERACFTRICYLHARRHMRYACLRYAAAVMMLPLIISLIRTLILRYADAIRYDFFILLPPCRLIDYYYLPQSRSPFACYAAATPCFRRRFCLMIARYADA